MKIFYSRYLLEGIPPFKNREGALLLVEYNDGKIGYCDCHPWHELGDLPLAQQLSLLNEGITTPLTAQSLTFAKIDANARVNKCNLFTNLKIPLSHYLVKSFEEPIPEQFTTVKIKGRDNLPEYLKALPKAVKIRLDFNNSHNHASFLKILDGLLEFKDQIDFIEDPFPYEHNQWNSISIPLATDFQPLKGPISIFKPAVDSIDLFQHCDRIIVTSYLDHPLGQLGAAYTAANLKNSEVCGLLSHLVYKLNAFSERITNQGPQLIPPNEGTGFGFNDLLEKLTWRSIHD